MRQESHVAHEQGFVDFKTRIQPAEAIVFGCVGRVMPGAEGFQLDPGRPRGGVAAFHTGGAQLLARLGNFLPGFWWLLGVESGLLEGIFVVVENRTIGRASWWERA